MGRAFFSTVLVCWLSWGCGDKQSDSGAPTGGAADSSAGSSSGSSGASEHTGGRGGGGQDGGGAAGSMNGGAAGHAGMSSGGSGNSEAGGQTVWPAWVDSCLASQAEKCGGSREYLVCIYGTDQEIASTMVSCSEPVRNYKDYCKCNVSGCGRDCRPAYQ
jgi:hypothetical protein